MVEKKNQPNYKKNNKEVVHIQNINYKNKLTLIL